MTAPIRNNNVIDPFSWDKNVIDFKGYNGSPNLKKSGITVNWTQEMLDEWIKCAKDPIYFSERYIKIIHVDHGLIPLSLYDYQKEVITNFQGNRKNIVLQSRQSGKALSLDTDIPLFGGGFKKMGDIVIGDKIIGNDGNPTTVTFLSEIHNKKTFRLTFSDGSKITACEDHLWEVNDSWNKNKKFILTTAEISKKYKRESYKKKDDGTLRKIQENKYYIENTAPVNYEKRILDIDPYVLGVWLGDGESASGRITCHVDDKEKYEKYGIKFSTETSHSKRKNIWTSTVVGLIGGLRKYNLIKNKHIPNDYLYSSIDDRISLLQGLMDTDGYIQKSGALLEFVQSSDRYEFVMQVKQLMESLGLTVYYKEKINKKYNKTYCYLTFSVSHSQFSPFRLERKLKRLKPSLRKSSTSRYIIDVSEVETVPTKCLTVDNDNHMFLCGRQYIPTHNTTVAVAIILHFMLFNEYKTVALLANKGDAALEIMGRIQLAYEYLPKWMQSGVIEWNKGSIEIENGCKILASATSGSAIRGKSCVSGDTIVRVKDKNNGCVYDTEIENINQHDYMIWDGDEFRTFDDVLIQEKETYQITYSNGTIRATEDHMFKTHDGKWICVSDIVVGQSLYGDNTVFSIEKYGTEFVYDPVNINVSNQYVSNGLISHNCSLLYIDECVAGDTSITVRNKYTGEVKRVTIEEFYDAICI